MPDNNFVVRQEITFKALAELKNQLNVIGGFNKSWWKQFGKPGAKIGDTLKIRKPQRFRSSLGAAITDFQPLSDTFTTVSINTHRKIPWQMGVVEKTLSIDDIYERYFAKAITQLANDADDDASLFAYRNTNNIQGALNTNPSTTAGVMDLFTSAVAQILENGGDSKALRAVITPRQAALFMNYLNANYNPNTTIGNQYLSGILATAFGFQKIAVDQNVYRHTAGVYAGSPVMASAAVDGDTSVATSGWTAGDILNPGDVFTIDAVFNVNPKNRRSTAILKRFVVGGDTPLVADGGGLMTIPLGGGFSFYGPLSQYQNVSALPAANATIVPWPGTTTPSGLSGTQAVAFGMDAFAFCPIELDDLPALECSRATDPETGISLAITMGGDIMNYKTIVRIDMAYGFGNLYPDNEAVRIVTGV